MGVKNSKSVLVSELKLILVEWLSNSTAHAIPNIARTESKLLRIVWLVSLLISASYCFYSVIVSLMYYFSYPTYVSTQVAFESSAKFPAVSMCNLKATNKTVLIPYLSELYNRTKTGIVNKSLFGNAFMGYSITQLYSIQAAIGNNGNLTESAKRAFGFEMSNMLLSCFYENRPCNANDFAYFYHPLYGNCYTFNKGYLGNGTSTPIIETSIPGVDSGLSFELFLGNPNVQTQYQYQEGMVLVIHNQSSVPTLDGDRILVSTNTVTDIKINRNFIYKLDAPYGDCYKESTSNRGEFVDYIVNTLGLTYSQNYCYLLCIQKTICEACNCSNGVLPAYMNVKMCSKETEIICATSLLRNFDTASRFCIENCKLECDSVKYSVSTSQATYPTVFYQDLLQSHPIVNKSGIPKADIGKSVLKLNIFYESLQYYAITEQPAINREEFFASIGGTLGLYLGISVLSTIEILELIIRLIQFCVEKRSLVKTAPTQEIKIESLN